ncbi:MAG: S8 family serine peptidase [Phycisphaerae bacterium]|nr:S8 family serine peptidase [Phycisphaerae bacterium]
MRSRIGWTMLLVGAVVAPYCSAAGEQAARDAVCADVWRLLARQGGPIKVWVMFSDKGESSPGARLRKMDKVRAEYDPRALARRLQRRTAPGLIDECDLPLSAEHVAAVTATGARMVCSSRWLNAISVRATAVQIKAIASLPFVKSIQPVGRGRRVMPEGVDDTAFTVKPCGFVSALDETGLEYGPSRDQLAQLNVLALHDLGYTGSGVVLALLDTGFYKAHETVHPERILAEWDFVENDSDTQDDADDPPGNHGHGTATLSVAAGRADGRLYGAGFGASLILCKTEDNSQETPIEEDYFVAGLEFAESHGADVVTSSLGYIDWYTQAQLDGLTAVTTVGVNTATSNGVFCCTAAGNFGPLGPSLIAPADAFQVITVGAVDGQGLIAGFSSRGPTADGRVKPEVVARGVSTWLASTYSPSGYGPGSGTSYATPLVAGVVVCLVQAHPDWSIDQLRAALFHTADYYVAHGRHDPDSARGYGLIDALAAHEYPFITGDFDFDRDVDGADLRALLACLTGPAVGPPDRSCRRADFDGDADVDQSDFGVFQRCYSGLDNPVDPDCAGVAN